MDRDERDAARRTVADVRAMTRRRALLSLLLLVPVPTLSVLTAMRWWPGPGGQAVYGAGKLWLLGLPVAWLLLVERDSVSLSPARRGGMATGAILGVAISVVIVAAWWLTSENDMFRDLRIPPPMIRRAARMSGIDEPVRYLGLALFLTLINSILEEYVWRWFVFRQAEALLPAAGAVVVSSLCFTLHHVVSLRLQMPWGPTILASSGVFVGGVIWSWCYLRYRSIWPGWLSHAIVDAAIFAIGWQLIFEESAAT